MVGKMHTVAIFYFVLLILHYCASTMSFVRNRIITKCMGKKSKEISLGYKKIQF